MRILYGVVGEGMGHATRSRVVIEHLLERGHELRVVVSGRAHDFLERRLQAKPGLSIHAIEGFHLDFDSSGIDLLETVLGNLELAPRRLRKNLEVYREIAEERFRPELVISDFESWAYLYARNHRLPVISIDNMQVLNRCEHTAQVTQDRSFDFLLARAAVKIKIPGAYHYLVTSFFYPRVRKARTTLIPPILRPEIVAARREPGEHVLVYQSGDSDEQLIPTLQRLPWTFHVYGMNKDETRGNVTLKPFSETGFVDDLRTAKAVLATGGFSLMSEAIHLRVPMLAVPIADQYEQELNCRYLATLGYGAWSPQLDEGTIERFLSRNESYVEALQAYEPTDNSMTLACVDELVRAVELGEKRPKTIQSPNRGAWLG